MKTICLEGRGPFGMHNEYLLSLITVFYYIEII